MGTLGEKLEALIKAYPDAARIDIFHGDNKWHEERMWKCEEIWSIHISFVPALMKLALHGQSIGTGCSLEGAINNLEVQKPYVPRAKKAPSKFTDFSF